MKVLSICLISLLVTSIFCDGECPDGQRVSSEDWSCYSPLVQGPCKQGEWLVVRNSSLLSCEKRKCEEDDVDVEGECVNIYMRGVCPFGERMYNNERGESLCHCEEGWAKEGRKSRCYQEFTRGPCGGTKMVRILDDTKGLQKFSCTARTTKSKKAATCKFPFIMDGRWIFGSIKGDPRKSAGSKGKTWCPTQLDMKRRFIKGSNLWGFCDEECPKDTKGSFLLSSHFQTIQKMMKASMRNMRKCQLTCVDNPCKQPFRNLPHSSTWSPSLPTPTCHPVLEDLRNCVVKMQTDGEGLVCSKSRAISGVQVNTLVPFSVAPLAYRRCSKGEVFSRFRRRCVRILID